VVDSTRNLIRGYNMLVSIESDALILTKKYAVAKKRSVYLVVARKYYEFCVIKFKGPVSEGDKVRFLVLTSLWKFKNYMGDSGVQKRGCVYDI